MNKDTHENCLPRLFFSLYFSLALTDIVRNMANDRGSLAFEQSVNDNDNQYIEFICKVSLYLDFDRQTVFIAGQARFTPPIIV